MPCGRCGIRCEFHENYFMVHDSLWKRTVKDCDSVLCLSCFESDLGRKTVPSDFKRIAMNNAFIHGIKSF